MNENVFSTMDAYIAGFLSLHGHNPTLVQEGPKIVFHFAETPEIQHDINKYHSGEKVEACRLAHAIKNLKSRMFLIKKNGERTVMQGLLLFKGNALIPQINRPPGTLYPAQQTSTPAKEAL